MSDKLPMAGCGVPAENLETWNKREYMVVHVDDMVRRHKVFLKLEALQQNGRIIFNNFLLITPIDIDWNKLARILYDAGADEVQYQRTETFK